ncbi:MAG: PAS domain S-box protein, partial [Bacillota bacterium]|nr:PAS domain S-box protein [Bacillota bacterium]
MSLEQEKLDMIMKPSIAVLSWIVFVVLIVALEPPQVLLLSGVFPVLIYSLAGGIKGALLSWLVMSATIMLLGPVVYQGDMLNADKAFGLMVMLPIAVAMGIFQDVNHKLKLTQGQLTAAKEKLQTLVNEIPEVLGSITYPNLQVDYISPSCKEVLGYSPEEYYQNPQHIIKSVYREDRKKINNFLKLITRTKATESFTIRIWNRNKDKMVWLENRVKPILDHNNEIIRLDTISIDITEKKLVEKKLWWEKEFSKLIVEKTPAIIIGVDRQGKIILFNKALEELTGYNREQVLGKSYSKLFVPVKERSETDEFIRSMFLENKTAKRQGKIITIDGKLKYISWNNSTITDINRQNSAIVGIGTDVTMELQAKEELEKKHRQLMVAHDKVRELSERDFLTDVYNRRYFEKCLSDMGKEVNKPTSIMVVDIDGLKLINDIYGHAKGDQLVKAVAKHLTYPLRQED